MEITKREIIASISIIAVMLIVGILISGKISEGIMDSNEKYNKAIQIESQEMFRYAMKTNAGNSFVYGDLKILDPVSYPEIEGKYSYVKKVKEKYTRHTRTVRSGKTTRIRVYWTWDRVDSESVKSTKATFLGVEFNYSQFLNLDTSYICTIKESSHIRYKYYGSPISSTGTIFTSLKDNNIGNDVKLYENMSINKTYKHLEKGQERIFLFWCIWSLFIGIIVYVFYYFENNWLN